MGVHPLKIAREKAGISQNKLGSIVGINPAEISRIEGFKRYPCPKWRDSISRYFKIAEHELFPTPEDLLSQIDYLQKENQALKQRIEDLAINSANLHKGRDYSRYVV
jgi:transcriptional regulator with XRE-family HTH domain